MSDNKNIFLPTWIDDETPLDEINMNMLNDAIYQAATDLGDLSEYAISKIDGVKISEKKDEYLFYSGDTLISSVEIPKAMPNSIIEISSSVAADLKVTKDSKVVIDINYANSNNISAKLDVRVGGINKISKRIDVGTELIDVTDYLSEGNNEVLIEVSDAYNGYDSLVFSVDVIALSVTSNFDYIKAYDGIIPVNYIANGNIEKNINFYIDGAKIGTEIVTTSAIQRVFNIPKQSHGNHLLEIEATCTVEGTVIRSNKLAYEIICIEAGNNTPIIATTFIGGEYEQYSVVSIPYSVYTPNNLNSNVELKINGETVNQVVVPREKEVYWNLSDYPVGDVALTIQTAGVTRTFNITVNELDIDISDVKEGLELHLNSSNRTNEDTNREVWEYGNVKAALNGFNWKSNGWILDEDKVSTLRVNEGANVIIPVKPFENDFKQMGKTLEFEFVVKDTTDYNAPIITCMNGDRGFEISCKEAILKTNETFVSCKYKENEKIRISFVIENTGKNRLIYTYINGICSGLKRYSTTDIFTQTSPVTITIGSAACTVDVYNIRTYARDLDKQEILKNYIFDISEISRKLATFNNNNIYDAYGEILYSKVLDRLPCMTITGELPPTKGNKKIVAIDYENKFDMARNFNHTGVTIDIQGTSSQFYPKKNYKFKLPVAYELREGAIAETTYTVKADYMESSHSHNTGMAKLVHGLYEDKTPPQLADDRIRTTIDGFPIIIFHRKTENDKPLFVGVYNFNNDKDNVKTFGYSGIAESWEICNNTSPRCLFQISDYDNSNINPETGDPEWLSDFEARYPEDNTNFTNLKRLTDWIVSTKDNPEKFAAEFDQYFNKEYVFTYYIVTELFGMVDSRAKNMFLSTWDRNIWYPVFYDMDTMLGLNNQGDLVFDYNIESTDVIGTQDVFNGKSSLLWENVVAAFGKEIEVAYKKLRDSGRLTYEKALDIFDKEQISQVAEALFNEDCQYKYIQPLIEDNDANNLRVAQGSRADHLKYWLYNRFKYMDSKYISSDYRDKYITLRLYTPTEWNGVKPNASFTITPFTSMYVGAKYGAGNGYGVYARAEANVPTVIQAPEITFNNTETIIYGADKIASLGDLSDKYAGTVDVTAATQLTELILGSSVAGYTNTNLLGISCSTNRLLKKLDVTNCVNISGALDLSDCVSLEELHLKNTKISTINFNEESSTLRKVYLPNTISNLTLLNKTKIEEMLIDGYENISILNIDNISPSVNPLSLLSNCTNVERVRLMNLDCRTTYNALNILKRCNGMDKDGNKIPISEAVSGKIVIAKCSEEMLSEYIEAFPHATITAAEISKTFTVTFKDGDGNTLYVDEVVEGGEAVYIGDTPTKTSTSQHHFEYNGWDRALKPILSNTVINATFNSIVRKYTIRFINPDTEEVLSEQSVLYGNMPTKPAIPQGYNSWSEAVTTVTGDKDYYCIYQPYPEDLSIFNFYSTTVGGVSGYICKLKPKLQFPSFLIFPFEYNNKPVFVIGYDSGDSVEHTEKSLIKEVYIPNTIVTIGERTFMHCRELTTIDIPESVTTIDQYAFYSCTKIENFDLKNIRTLGAYSFKYCNAVQEINCPNVTIFPMGVLNACANLRYVYAGSEERPFTSVYNTTMSSSQSLYGCTNLKTVFLVTKNGLSTDVSYINNIGTHISRIIFSKTPISIVETTDETYVISNNQAKLTEVKIPYTDVVEYTIKDTINGIPVVELGSEVFKDYRNLANITMSDNIISIGASCFSGCGKLTSITLPSNLTILEDSCFNGCYELTTVNIPDKVVSIGNNCFRSCSKLNSIILPNSVTTLGDYCFYNCGSLTDFVFSDNIKSIGTNSFYYCSKLENIILPESLTVLGTYAFSYCSKLRNISIPKNVNIIEESCFVGTTSLQLIEIQRKSLPITQISGSPWGANASTKVIYTFEKYEDEFAIYSLTEKNEYSLLWVKDKSLDSFSIKSTIEGKPVTLIGKSCFENCSSLTSINIPDNINTLEANSFQGCTSLATVTGLKGVKTLGIYAFQSCSSLKELTLPGNVDTISANIFSSCTILDTLQFGSVGTPITSTTYWNSSVFNTNTATINIYTQDGTGDTLTGQPWGGTSCTFVYKQA